MNPYIFTYSFLFFLLAGCGNSIETSDKKETKLDSIATELANEEVDEVQRDAIKEEIDYDTLHLDSLREDTAIMKKE